MKLIKPSKLKKGDTIAIIAPSGGLGAIFPHRVDNGINYLESIGFNIKQFPTIRKMGELGNSGSEIERVADIHNAFKDKSIKAIICNIGGIASNTILNKIDYDLIKENPKIFCGYSDISLLHLAFLKFSNLITFYGPCLMTQFAEFPKPLDYTTKYFLKTLLEGNLKEIEASKEWTDEVLDWSQKKDLERPRNLKKNKGYLWLKKGFARGKLIGGCLFSLCQIKGTPFEPEYKDKILFIETPEGQNFSKGEPLEYVGSQLMDLENAGVFKKIKGLIVGRGYGYSKDESNQFKSLIEKYTKSYDFPVLFNVNIGHADPIITLPIGVEAILDSSLNKFSIDETYLTEN